MKPEIFTIKYWEVARATHVDDLANVLLHKVCCCGHIAYFHKYQVLRHPDRLEDEFAFGVCTRSCGCYMFKQDNLAYLEDLVAKREQQSSM